MCTLALREPSRLPASRVPTSAPAIRPRKLPAASTDIDPHILTYRTSRSASRDRTKCCASRPSAAWPRAWCVRQLCGAPARDLHAYPYMERQRPTRSSTLASTHRPHTLRLPTSSRTRLRGFLQEMFPTGMIKEEGYICKVGLPCCTYALKQPSVLVKGKAHFLFVKQAASFPFDSELVPSPICAVRQTWGKGGLLWPQLGHTYHPKLPALTDAP